MTLLLVNIFPARRARDILMLMGLLFAGSLVLLLRMIQPEQLLRVESLPDITDFFATLQSPATPLLPSFWAAETVFAALQGRFDALHMAALWTTALALIVLAASAYERWHFTGFSKAQEGRKVRFTQLALLDRVARVLPMSPVHRHLLVKDLKLFLRDVSQWSQLLLLLALVLVYLYNFRVLDLDKIPYMSGMMKNVYAFVNLAMAGLVMSTVCARFVLPGGVGRRGGVLDHPHRADLAPRVPVVEVLDRAAAGVRAHRGADHRGQLLARHRSAAAHRLGGRGRSSWRSRWSGSRPASARATRGSTRRIPARSPDRTAAWRS